MKTFKYYPTKKNVHTHVDQQKYDVVEAKKKFTLKTQQMT